MYYCMFEHLYMYSTTIIANTSRLEQDEDVFATKISQFTPRFYNTNRQKKQKKRHMNERRITRCHSNYNLAEFHFPFDRFIIFSHSLFNNRGRLCKEEEGISS